MEYINPAKCEVCGGLTFTDDYGNSDKCPHCGWIQSCDSETMEELRGISYPMLVSLSRAREQYRNGQKFKATFDEFINGLKFYSEMLFWHKGIVYETYTEFSGDVGNYRAEDCSVKFCSEYIKQEYANVKEFREKANIDGRLLKDIWDEVVHPCFMYCGGEHDYDFPPED